MSSARDALLREFRWAGGHADVWAVFRDADALFSGPKPVNGLAATKALAVTRLIESCGGELVGISVLVDQLDSSTRSLLPSVHALVTFADLPPYDG